MEIRDVVARGTGQSLYRDERFGSRADAVRP